MKTLLPLLFFAAFTSLCATISVAGQTAGHDKNSKLPESAPISASRHADVRKHTTCPHCGMNRQKFSHSRMLISYTDGTSAGVCSIHCAAIELKASRAKTVKSVEVADFQTRLLIPAEQAFWVIGGSEKGVMTTTPKWAFTRQESAHTFIQVRGGTLVPYSEALSRAEKD